MTKFEDIRETANTPLDQTKIVMLRLLQVADDICKRHNIPYWVMAGTLLGAVRHKGFIPWDDDLDIGMLREDWNRFIKIARTELPDDIFLQLRPEDFDYDLPFAKFRDKYSSVYEINEKGDEKYHKGIFIDIFPYDYFPANPKIQSLLERLFKFLFYSENALNTLRKRKDGFSGLLKKMVWRISKIIPIRSKMAILYWVGEKSKNGKSPHITPNVGLWDYPFYPIEHIFPLTELEFCGFKVPAPGRYHEHLTQIFGDYNKLPPKADRIGHFVWVKPFEKCDHSETLDWNKSRSNTV